jgi:hypothetical protein
MLAGLGTALLLYSFEASALAQPTIDEMLIASGAVIVATVDSVSNVAPIEDGKTAPLTRYRLCAVELLAGALPKHTALSSNGCFELDVPGGLFEDGVRGSGVSGMPSLQASTRYLMFLTTDAPYTCPWVFWEGGVFEVRGKSDGGWLFSLGGTPLAFVRANGQLGYGATIATYLEETPGATEVPFGIVAESPVSIREMEELLDARSTSALPEDWQVRRVFGSEE